MKKDILIARIPEPRRNDVGISDSDIARVSVNSELVDDVMSCLESPEAGDLIFGLFFLDNLLAREEFRQVVHATLPALAERIRAALVHADWRVRNGAVLPFVALREHYPDYHEVMLKLLADFESGVQHHVLQAAPTFLTRENLNALLPFRDHPEFSETRGMGGPLRYVLRDYALEIAEKISGRKFEAIDCFETRDENQISWRSWAPFMNWFESQKRTWF